MFVNSDFTELLRLFNDSQVKYLFASSLRVANKALDRTLAGPSSSRLDPGQASAGQRSTR